MLKSVVLIFLFLFVGEGLSFLFELDLPGNVIGMVLLTLSLQLKWIDLSDVERLSNALLKNLALFFVPPGVGMMLYFDLMKEQWLTIFIANIISTIAVLLTVGFIVQMMEKKNA